MEMIKVWKYVSTNVFLRIYNVCYLLNILLKNKTKFLFSFLDWHQLTLDPNTVYHSLGLSEDNRKVWWRRGLYRHSDHPERFDSTPQVLCKESLSGRCYWEVKCNGGELGVLISVSYKGIKRRGRGNECVFGYNDQSWSLWCPSSPSLQHNNVKTLISGQSPSKIGV